MIKIGFKLLKTKIEALVSRIMILGQKRKDFIITGMPRSGTSLLAALLTTETGNCVCFNEIHYNINTLPLFFSRMRSKLRKGEAIPNKVTKEGKWITSLDDSNKNSIHERNYKVNNKNVVIGSKITIPYLDQIEKLLNFNYKIIAIVRNPVYALGSWHTKKLLNTPMGMVLPENLHSHWQNVNFFSEDKIERQAQIWEHYAHLIWTHRDKIKIIKYENLVNHHYETMKNLCSYLGLELNISRENLKNCNIDSRYGDLKEIKESVKRYCVSRKHYGYL